jgi:carboxymethylenebutenolidase
MYEKHSLKVQDSDMEVLVFRPEGEGPHPGLIVCQHIPVSHAGLEKDPWQIGVGERLAKAGYVVVMPWVFHWWPAEADISVKRDGFRDDWAVADLAAAFDLLVARSDVDAERVGIIGHCWGGRVSWLGACHNPKLKALVTLYGGRIKVPLADGATPPIELVGGMGCSVLGIFGNDDGNPSPADVEDFRVALSKAGVPHVFHQYDGAGHGFQDDSNPDRYREAQSNDAWEKIEAFLGDTLG